MSAPAEKTQKRGRGRPKGTTKNTIIKKNKNKIIDELYKSSDNAFDEYTIDDSTAPQPNAKDPISRMIEKEVKKKLDKKYRDQIKRYQNLIEEYDSVVNGLKQNMSAPIQPVMYTQPMQPYYQPPQQNAPMDMIKSFFTSPIIPLIVGSLFLLKGETLQPFMKNLQEQMEEAQKKQLEEVEKIAEAKKQNGGPSSPPSTLTEAIYANQ